MHFRRVLIPPLSSIATMVASSATFFGAAAMVLAISSASVCGAFCWACAVATKTNLDQVPILSGDGRAGDRDRLLA